MTRWRDAKTADIPRVLGAVSRSIRPGTALPWIRDVGVLLTLRDCLDYCLEALRADLYSPNMAYFIEGKWGRGTMRGGREVLGSGG
jgi:hypothetical protein